MKLHKLELALILLAVALVGVIAGVVIMQVPTTRTNNELELRLLNLEELHTVTINNKVLTVEHVDVPTSSTVTYVKIPMNEWVKYEHLFGR